MSGRTLGASIVDSLSPSQPRLTEPDLFRGESGAYRSTLESKILGSSSFSTGVSAHMEAGQRWIRSNTGIRSNDFLIILIEGCRGVSRDTHSRVAERTRLFPEREYSGMD